MKYKSSESHRRAVRKYQEEHRKKKLCLRCPEPVAPGYLFCQECLIKHRDIQKRIYYERYDQRIEQNRKKKARYRKEGRCVSCGAPLGEQDEGHVKCVNCRIAVSSPPRPQGIPYYGGNIYENN